MGPGGVLAVYVASSTAAGGTTGAALAAIGHQVPVATRAAGATLVALGALALAAGALAGRIAPLQCDRETPRRWVDAHGQTWPIKNGLTLGFGATTRIGFPLWYVLGVAAFLTGSVAAGALIYGVYGFTRSGAAGVVMWMARYRPVDQINDTLSASYFLASRVTNLWLMFLAAATLVAVGT